MYGRSHHGEEAAGSRPRAALFVQDLPVADVAVGEIVVVRGLGGPEQNAQRQSARHATSTHVFMPDAWCPSVWQCRSHLPGLSNTQRMSRLCRASTSVVSR